MGADTNVGLIPSGDQINQALKEAYNKYDALTDGVPNIDYPKQAWFDRSKYGIVIVTVQGKVYKIGNADSTFPIESNVKPFTLAAVLMQSHNQSELLDKIGVHATGLGSASPLSFYTRQTKKQNAMVNSGALVTVSMVIGKNDKEKWEYLSDLLLKISGSTFKIESKSISTGKQI